MKILLDTQIALWVFLDGPRLTPPLRQILKDPANELLFSQISIWEIQIKYDLGKLPLPQKPQQVIPSWAEQSGFQSVGIQNEAIFMLGQLPSIHRDPFDRLLIAHALVNGWTLLTSDDTIKRYPVLTA